MALIGLLAGALALRADQYMFSETALIVETRPWYVRRRRQLAWTRVRRCCTTAYATTEELNAALVVCVVETDSDDISLGAGDYRDDDLRCLAGAISQRAEARRP